MSKRICRIEKEITHCWQCPFFYSLCLGAYHVHVCTAEGRLTGPDDLPIWCQLAIVPETGKEKQ